jgi:large conductance mechanosensitive channel
LAPAIITRMRKGLSGFVSFLSRGNVVDLAVAVVVGLAFQAVIKAFVADLLTPLIAAIVGKPDFGRLVFTVHHAQFRYGDFVNSVLSFLFVTAAVYFFLVVPMRRLQERRNRQGAEAATLEERQLAVLEEIRDAIAVGRIER